MAKKKTTKSKGQVTFPANTDERKALEVLCSWDK